MVASTTEPDVNTEIIVCETLTAEHRESELLLDRLEAELNTFVKEPTEAHYNVFKETVTLLHNGMNTHFACEEEALFPMLSKYHSMVLMEAEHEMLIELRVQLEALPMGEVLKIKEISNQFIEDLRNHISREDAGIFPEAEACLLPREKKLVMAHMQEIRAKAALEGTPELYRAERFFEVIPALKAIVDDNKPVNIQLLGKNAALQIKQLTIQAGAEIKEHWSPEGVWLYLLSGRAEFKSAAQSAILTAGESILLTPQLKHQVKALDACQFLAVFSEHHKA